MSEIPLLLSVRPLARQKPQQQRLPKKFINFLFPQTQENWWQDHGSYKALKVWMFQVGLYFLQHNLPAKQAIWSFWQILNISLTILGDIEIGSSFNGRCRIIRVLEDCKAVFKSKVHNHYKIEEWFIRDFCYKVYQPSCQQNLGWVVTGPWT